MWFSVPMLRKQIPFNVEHDFSTLYSFFSNAFCTFTFSMNILISLACAYMFLARYTYTDLFSAQIILNIAVCAWYFPAKGGF